MHLFQEQEQIWNDRITSILFYFIRKSQFKTYV